MTDMAGSNGAVIDITSVMPLGLCVGCRDGDCDDLVPVVTELEDVSNQFCHPFYESYCYK